MTEAFLSEFPTDPGNELVTKQFLRAELAELRAELRSEISGEAGSLRLELADLRTDMERIHTKAMRTTLGAMGVMTALITILN